MPVLLGSQTSLAAFACAAVAALTLGIKQMVARMMLIEESKHDVRPLNVVGEKSTAIFATQDRR
jgi:hypothetical protein